MKFLNFLFYSPTIFAITVYPFCSTLDKMLNICMKHGIQSYKRNTNYHTSTVIFNNGVTYEFWDASKYAGWLSDGKIDSFSYKNCMPKRSTMRKFRRLLDNFEENEYNKIYG